MLEGFGNGSDDVKSKRLPKSHGTMIRFHDGVELHGGVSLLLSPRERVLAKGASDSLASRVASAHETRRLKSRTSLTRPTSRVPFIHLSKSSWWNGAISSLPSKCVPSKATRSPSSVKTAAKASTLPLFQPSINSLYRLQTASSSATRFALDFSSCVVVLLSKLVAGCTAWSLLIRSSPFRGGKRSA